MNLKNILLIAYCACGVAFAALYCQVADVSWQCFVQIDNPPDCKETQQNELGQYLQRLPKGRTGHGISFLGMPIEEEYDCGAT